MVYPSTERIDYAERERANLDIRNDDGNGNQANRGMGTGETTNGEGIRARVHFSAKLNGNADTNHSDKGGFFNGGKDMAW